MEKFSSRSCAKWSFDEDEVPAKCRVRRRRQEEEFLKYVTDGRSCMIVGLPGSGRHVFSVMMQEELEKDGIQVKRTTFANLGTGDMAFQRMMEILGFGVEGVDLPRLTLEKAKDVFVQRLENRDRERNGTLCLFIDSFDSCCRLPNREEFLVQFFDTNVDGTLWRKAGFVPVLVSTRTSKMIEEYRPGMGSPFERHYQQHCIDMKPFGQKEVEDFCGCSKRTIAYADMELLVKQVGSWPGVLRMVLSNYNSHRELTMEKVLHSQDVRQQLDDHYSPLVEFFAKFGKGFGLAEGVTLFDCLSALVAGRSLPKSKAPRSIYELFMEYGLIIKEDDDARYVCNVSELGAEFIKRISGVDVDFVEEKKRRASSGGESSLELGPVASTTGGVLTLELSETSKKKQVLVLNGSCGASSKYSITSQKQWDYLDLLLKANNSDLTANGGVKKNQVDCDGKISALFTSGNQPPGAKKFWKEHVRKIKDVKGTIVAACIPRS